MRELKGDWKDLFNGFMLALDLRKMFLGLCALLFTLVPLAATYYVARGIDDKAVPRPSSLHVGELCDTFGRSFDQTGRPVLRSKATIRASIPTATSRSPTMSGVACGPGPCSMPIPGRNGASQACSQRVAPVAASMAMATSWIPRRYIVYRVAPSVTRPE